MRFVVPTGRLHIILVLLSHTGPGYHRDWPDYSSSGEYLDGSRPMWFFAAPGRPHTVALLSPAGPCMRSVWNRTASHKGRPIRILSARWITCWPFFNLLRAMLRKQNLCIWIVCWREKSCWEPVILIRSVRGIIWTKQKVAIFSWCS